MFDRWNGLQVARSGYVVVLWVCLSYMSQTWSGSKKPTPVGFFVHGDVENAEFAIIIYPCACFCHESILERQIHKAGVPRVEHADTEKVSEAATLLTLNAMSIWGTHCRFL
jgi:hypothetical protein